MPKSVFLSYSTDDTTVVTKIREHLEAQDIACWLAPRDIVPGLDYAEQIISAIESAVVLVLVLSESSNHSTYVRNEVERAVAKGKAIIPFRIHKVQPSRSLEFFISNHQWVEAWQLPLAPKLDVLAEAIDRHIAHEGQSHEEITPSRVTGVTADARQAPAHNLPHQLTPFIGREQELAAIDDLLSKPDVRLVTILGPGGMGKTRLALAVAERYLSDARFAQGVYFVALAPLLETDHIVSTLADVLGLSLQSGEGGGVQQQVCEYLRAKAMLLVFDNFEHLLEGAGLVAQILQVAAAVCVLATSRERLRVPGEYLFHIQGLGYDDPALHTTGHGAAEQLFVQSARQVLPDVDFGAEELIQISNICRLVGGMPLGIELAAAWIEVLTPEEIVAEIQRSLDFLEADRRGGVEHHRSVRAVFDASWQRLTPAEQTVFAQLSIFRGGFTREAAEEVAGATLRLLSTLAGKSLIHHERARGRYTLHELLRQFGEEKLRIMPERWEETHEHHSNYYLSFVQQREGHLKGSRQLEAKNEIEIEIENVRFAWQWAVTNCKVEELDNCLEGLRLFYHLKSWYRESEVVFRQAAAHLRMDKSAGKQGVVYGRLLAAQGLAQINVSHEMDRLIARENTEAVLQESLMVLNHLGARPETAPILMALGESDRTGQMWQEAQELLEESNDQWTLARLLEQMGNAAKYRGDYEQAKQHYLRGIAISKQLGTLWGVGMIQNVLGEVYRALGQYAEARGAAQEALAARQAVNDKRGVAFSLYLLGDLAWRAGNLDEARQFSMESVRMFDVLGLRWGGDLARYNLGNIAFSEEDMVEAKEHFFAILAPRLAAGTLDSDRVTDAFTGLAAVLASEGEASQAMELLRLAIDIPGGLQETKDQATKLLDELTERFPDQSPASIRPLEVVVAEVLNA